MATTRRRPNPAVAAAEREAQIAEDLAAIAKRQDRGPMRGESVARATRAMATRRRRTASRIKKEHPFLIEVEE